MKVLLFFLLAVFPLRIIAQTQSYGSFKVDNQEIIYQKIFFQDSITLDKLGDYYVSLSYVSDLDMSNDEVKFKLNDIAVDYKKFQFAQVATPPIIQTGKYSGLVTVNAKDGKYRVTVRSIQLTGDIGYKKSVKRMTLPTMPVATAGPI
ncbi:MAG TPA: hypothetical protein VD884_01055 [Ohtaekwangia sp.]|nr:hypothetical protein [Ohtaekwangia sp.]